MVAAEKGRWGTWEELLLGGAVLRYGTQSWNAVALELRARTVYPYSFTAEACEAKFEDLKQRFSGCKAWFEELRKKRVAELRQELEKSENSIGSLESKLESLKTDKENCCHFAYDSIRFASPVRTLKSEGIESSGNDTSMDGLSAGSFCQIQESVVEITAHPEVSRQEKLLSTTYLSETSNERGVILQKRRGKRKRKDYCKREEHREWSIEESENLSSEFSNGEENSTSEFAPMVKNSSCMNDYERGSRGVGNGDLIRIFNSIAENGNALVFRRRLDSQKRRRYKKTIRSHMDFDTIRTRIGSCFISTANELFRDMLLVANNAVFFYAKRTREYKSALLLREIVTKTYRHHEKRTPSLQCATLSLDCSQKGFESKVVLILDLSRNQ